MEAIYLLIPIALVLVVVAVAVFFWAVKSDQFEDLEGPAHSILFDNDAKGPQDPPQKRGDTSPGTADEQPSRSEQNNPDREL